MCHGLGSALLRVVASGRYAFGEIYHQGADQIRSANSPNPNSHGRTNAYGYSLHRETSGSYALEVEARQFKSVKAALKGIQRLQLV
jgi:hypothetical protein